jgi:hypothetical protein
MKHTNRERKKTTTKNSTAFNVIDRQMENSHLIYITAGNFILVIPIGIKHEEIIMLFF